MSGFELFSALGMAAFALFTVAGILVLVGLAGRRMSDGAQALACSVMFVLAYLSFIGVAIPAHLRAKGPDWLFWILIALLTAVLMAFFIVVTNSARDYNRRNYRPTRLLTIALVVLWMIVAACAATLIFSIFAWAGIWNVLVFLFWAVIFLLVLALPLIFWRGHNHGKKLNNHNKHHKHPYRLRLAGLSTLLLLVAVPLGIFLGMLTYGWFRSFDSAAWSGEVPSWGAGILVFLSVVLVGMSLLSGFSAVNRQHGGH